MDDPQPGQPLVAIPLDVGELLPDGRDERGKRTDPFRLREEPGDRLLGPFGVVGVREQHGVLFDREVVEERARGHARFSGDVVDGDLVQATLVDQPKRRESDRAVGFELLALAKAGRGHRVSVA